jgi:uncharacterized protein YkwD
MEPALMKAPIPRALILILLLTSLLAAPAAAQEGVEPSDGNFMIYLPLIRTTTPSIAQDVVVLVNQERARVGCPPLGVSPQLSVSAQGHSQDMALNNIFSHTGSDGSSPWDRMAATGYTAGAAENVAAGYATADLVMAVWMRSAGHRANILNCGFSEIGVGFYDQPDDQPNVRLDNGDTTGPFRYYWTQDFGAP